MSDLDPDEAFALALRQKYGRPKPDRNVPEPEPEIQERTSMSDDVDTRFANRLMRSADRKSQEREDR